MKILARISWLAMTFLALFLFAITSLYWSFRTDINFLLEKQDVVHWLPWRIAFYIHILGGMLAIAAGPFQFLAALRRKYPKIHRNLGKIYVASILFLAAPSGLFMALFAEGGQWSGLGFLLMSFVWFFSTLTAYRKAKRKNFIAHERWMIRSYAVTFAAVTLRLWVPLLSLGFGMEPDFVIILTAWISWAGNLIFAEFLILLIRQNAMRAGGLKSEPLSANKNLTS